MDVQQLKALIENAKVELAKRNCTLRWLTAYPYDYPTDLPFNLEVDIKSLDPSITENAITIDLVKSLFNNPDLVEEYEFDGTPHFDDRFHANYGDTFDYTACWSMSLGFSTNWLPNLFDQLNEDLSADDSSVREFHLANFPTIVTFTSAREGDEFDTYESEFEPNRRLFTKTLEASLIPFTIDDIDRGDTDEGSDVTFTLQL